MNRTANEPHLQQCRQDSDYPVWFNREMFALDFIQAWRNYLADVEASKDMQDKVYRRIKDKQYLRVDLVNLISS